MVSVHLKKLKIMKGIYTVQYAKGYTSLKEFQAIYKAKTLAERLNMSVRVYLDGRFHKLINHPNTDTYSEPEELVSVDRLNRVVQKYDAVIQQAKFHKRLAIR